MWKALQRWRKITQSEWKRNTMVFRWLRIYFNIQLDLNWCKKKSPIYDVPENWLMVESSNMLWPLELCNQIMYEWKLILKMWIWILFYRLRYVKPPEGAGVMEAAPAETSDSQYHPPRITEMLSFNAAVLPLVKELGMQ